ncbi:unnamed protein product [Arctia plantaginis]|uniref:receptor protein-tyrosine kinase n=1 Tax=Arctia plantaginis TaxID=874455 RepID=A0A8S1AC37_ARCPL|nr:unnamed protein product [Arctia plantaginis]
MFNKKIEHYVILYLLKQIIFKPYVSGKPIDTEVLTISDDQLKYLVDIVCPALESYVGVELESCQTSFAESKFLPNLDFDDSSSEQSHLAKVRCTNQDNVRFQVEPSQNWQLVVLVPEPTNDTEADKYSINYSLIPPKIEYEEVSTTPIGNYTLWNTDLRVQEPLKWRGGFILPQYNQVSIPEPQKYDINVEFFKGNEEKNTFLNGLFTWNATGELDVCFDVVNSCGKSGIRDFKIWPDSKAHKFLYNLPLDDKCDIRVTGLYGTTKLSYRTPKCDDGVKCLLSNRTPEIPTNVSIEATEDTADTWNVHVAWSPPLYPVELYNITLHAKDVKSLKVPGNETEVVFKGISGFGLYYVELHAKLGRKTAITSRRAFFPAHLMPESEVAARGAALGAAACAAAVLAIVCVWRRVRSPYRPDEPPSDEPPKKGDIDGISTTMEIEDSWEIRLDKLLLHEVIGEGAFGVVRRATLAPNGTNVAVKMLKDFPSLDEIRSFRSEMELMKSVGVHPHLVSLVGVCSGRRPLIIAEYCSRGDLLTYLRCTWDIMVSKRNAKNYNNNIDSSDYRNDLFKCKMQMENSKLVVNKLYELQDICDRELTSLDLLSFCRQIAMGMEFLAANRVVHRDLAARNILVTGDRTLKIADFGLSRDVYEENQYKQKGNGKMPVKWMALESLTRRIYTTASDVWSFGVVMWEVATVGEAPYASTPAARLPRLLRAGYRMPPPANCSPQLYDVMLSCWRAEPRCRPTFAELHARLDQLLHDASSHPYLALELEPTDAPPTPKSHRYFKMLIRGKNNWSRGESYERPLKPLQSNHYTSPPQVLSKVPAV